MGKKKLLDCFALIMYLMLCLSFRVVLAKEIPEKMVTEVVGWLDSVADAAKKWMDEIPSE